MKRSLVKLICASTLVLLLTVLPEVLKAVLVAPHAVFMSHRDRTGEITLINTSDEPEEVSVALQFGYPDGDSTGGVLVRLFEDPAPHHPSAAGWIRAFPQRMRLAPGQRQVVRLFATPPADLHDGEYWSRVLITSKGGVVPVAGSTDAVTAGLSLEIRTIISLNYRKGDVYTGVALNDLKMGIANDSLIVWVELERQGNAAYLGQLRLGVQSFDGARTLLSESMPVAVYYTLNRRYAFALDEAAEPGTYNLTFDLDTNREDFDDLTNVLPAEPITRTIPVEVRGR